MEYWSAQFVGNHVRQTLETVRDLYETDTGCCIDEEIGAPYRNVEFRSYKDAGILTNDAGFVLSLPDGSEFQVTVVKSR
jgi:hypothetical protein